MKAKRHTGRDAGRKAGGEAVRRTFCRHRAATCSTVAGLATQAHSEAGDTEAAAAGEEEMEVQAGEM